MNMKKNNVRDVPSPSVLLHCCSPESLPEKVPASSWLGSISWSKQRAATWISSSLVLIKKDKGYHRSQA